MLSSSLFRPNSNSILATPGVDTFSIDLALIENYFVFSCAAQTSKLSIPTKSGFAALV